MTGNPTESPISCLTSLEEWQSFKPGLARVRFVLEKMGNPHLNFPHILVGGTNGKGTVAHNIARLGPGKTGLYLSPHIEDVRERITVDGGWLPDGQWREVHAWIKRVAGDPELSYFEWLLVLSVGLFAVEKVEFAVFEVGMGGRLDATNALDPNVSVITNVDLDHVEWLGDTVEAIALEKIQISREGRPLILPAALLELPGIQRELAEIGCRVRALGGHGFENNLPTVNAVVEALGWSGPIHRLAMLPGRREILEPDLPIVVDGAHNEAAWRDLAGWYQHEFTTPVRLLCGLSRGRDPRLFLEIMRPLATEVILWNADFERELPPEAWPASVRIIQTKNLGELLEKPLLVCGSLYLVGAFRTFWRLNQRSRHPV